MHSCLNNSIGIACPCSHCYTSHFVKVGSYGRQAYLTDGVRASKSLSSINVSRAVICRRKAHGHCQLQTFLQHLDRSSAGFNKGGSAKPIIKLTSRSPERCSCSRPESPFDAQSVDACCLPVESNSVVL